MTTSRPLSVSIISWYLIISSLLGLLLLPSSLSNPLTQRMIEGTRASHFMIILMNLVSVSVYVGAGICMLKGKEWGRKIYFIGTPVVILLGAFSYDFHFLLFQIIAFVIYVVIIYFLTRKVVLAYFKGSYLEDAVSITSPILPQSQKPDNVKRFVSIILLFIGGMFLLPWFMMISILPENILVLIFVSAIFLGISSAFVITSIWLWGWNKWAVLLGAFFIATGGFSAFMGCMFFMFSSPDMKYLFKEVDTSKFSDMGGTSLISGVLVIVIGALLVYYQRKAKNDSIVQQQV
jgi:hypothetical protein